MSATVSAWNDLASSPRWHGLVSFIRNWIGPIDPSLGMSTKELDAALRGKRLRLPAAVREWYLLAGGWTYSDWVARWVPPQSLAVHDGFLQVLGDAEGITSWDIRAADLSLEDPPVIAAHNSLDRVALTKFSDFAAYMIANGVLFGEKGYEQLVEVDVAAARAALTPLFPSIMGDLLSDARLESAAAVVFCYPEQAYGLARTSAARGLLERMQYERGA